MTTLMQLLAYSPEVLRTNMLYLDPNEKFQLLDRGSRQIALVGSNLEVEVSSFRKAPVRVIYDASSTIQELEISYELVGGTELFVETVEVSTKLLYFNLNLVEADAWFDPTNRQLSLKEKSFPNGWKKLGDNPVFPNITPNDELVGLILQKVLVDHGGQVEEQWLDELGIE